MGDEWIHTNCLPKSKEVKEDGLFLIVTLSSGTRVAGPYTGTAYASLSPYDRDLFFGQLWRLDDGVKPIEAIQGSIGMYIDQRDILTVEILNYRIVVNAAKKAKEPE